MASTGSNGSEYWTLPMRESTKDSKTIAKAIAAGRDSLKTVRAIVTQRDVTIQNAMVMANWNAESAGAILGLWSLGAVAHYVVQLMNSIAEPQPNGLAAIMITNSIYSNAFGRLTEIDSANLSRVLMTKHREYRDIALEAAIASVGAIRGYACGSGNTLESVAAMAEISSDIGQSRRRNKDGSLKRDYNPRKA